MPTTAAQELTSTPTSTAAVTPPGSRFYLPTLRK
jgi:hypothetical protein